MNDIQKISRMNISSPLKFSVCTIVNNAAEYDTMKRSFEDKNFKEGCEYLIADNTKQNEFDAYEAISHFLKAANGEFIVIVHQDVRLKDNKENLLSCLEQLEKKDSRWAICGNAGANGYHNAILHIGYELHEEKTPGLPLQVNSLDENFLVIKRSTNMTISADLRGFHLYGTDLCIIALFLGYTCYVIPFMLLHLSKGNIPALEKYKPEFIKEYGRKMQAGYIQTTCTKFYLSNSSFKNRFLNSPPVFFIVKQFERFPYLWRSVMRKKN